MTDDKDSLIILRHRAGSIDLEDIEEKPMSEGERKEYTAIVSAAWPTLKKDIKKLQKEQLEFVTLNAGNWEQVLFGRGTWNGLDLIYQLLEKANTEHEGYIEENKSKENKNYATND